MSSFTDHLPDVFAKLGPITLKNMFGGCGIYHQDVMFALVADDTLYLKTDSGNLSYFEEKGLEPFEYTGKDGRTVRMSYHRAPDEIFDNPVMAAQWAKRSWEAAQRQHTKKPPPRKLPQPPPLSRRR